MSEEVSAWAVGWALFAAVVFMVIGVFQAAAGLVALIEDEFYAVGAEWVFQFNVTTWGWIHLIFGVVIFLTGLGILYGNLAARTIGVIIAALSAIGNFIWLPYQPVWSVIIIALDVAVIWALTVHGRDIVAADAEI